MKNSQRGFEKFFYISLYSLPLFLIAGLFDYRFHTYFWPNLDFLRLGSPNFLFDFWSIFDWYIAVLFIAYFFKKISYKTPSNTPQSKIAFIVSGLVITAVAINAYTYTPITPILHSFRWYTGANFIGPVVLLLVLCDCLRNQAVRQKFIRIFLLTFAALGISAIFEYFTDILPGANRDFLGRLVWPYIDPFVEMRYESANWMAFIFGPLTVLTCIKYKENKKYFGFLFIIFAVVLLLTRSYMGIATVLLLSGYYLFRRLPSRTKKYLIIGTCIGVLILIATQWNTRKFQIFLGKDVQESSLTRRLEIYTFTIDALIKKPLTGIGPANYQSFFRANVDQRKNIPENQIPPHPHNLLLFSWSELGLLGLLAFIGIYLVVGAALIYVPQQTPFAFSLAALLLHGLFDTPYGLAEISYLFWIFTALFLIDFQLHRHS